jgi:putative membrane protein insertion efficiency factor
MKKTVLRLLIAYKYFISPLLGNRCRFSPSCSEYMMNSIEEYGVLKGFFMGLRRVLKCGPWNPGGYDPVPPKHNHDL